MKNNTYKDNDNEYPFISICTPTYNRRPFIPYIIKCFQHQIYPQNRMEWIIIDDGTDKIEDLVKDIPQVKYFKYEEKMTLGKKRNLSHEKSCGEIIVYMDDDDFYPPQRVSHAIDMLKKNPTILCAGSSEMYIYFKHIQKMYQFGPYGPNHSTAASFAFRRELLEITSFQETACLAEEKYFLKNYTIPLIQLEPLNTLLVFSHIHNSFDKKTLLTSEQKLTESSKSVCDFVKDEYILKYFMEDIDNILEIYEHGRPENKMDVMKQMEEIKIKREAKIKEHHQQQQEKNEKQILYFIKTINNLTSENEELQNRIKHLEDKIREMITENINQKKK